ncbi:MAG: putative sugar O-methyltransferase [Ignavibacteriae bacterium]|nr:putative sugar O-methyltransferase [Ignavibacteriota bacterium]
MTNQEFSDWWLSYRSNPKIPEQLREMEDYFIDSGLLVYSSNFWNDYNKLNIIQLTDYGFDNFKQTVTKNYFTWAVTIDHPYANNLKKLVPNLKMLFSTGKRVSQDIFNSLLEYLSVIYHCPMNEVSTIIEIGAGSGRTAFCFLSLNPDKKYVIVDFPPALYVSQTYLLDVFKDLKVMSFRPFESFDEIADEYSKANIVFLTPDQLGKIPDHIGDLFLAIDCLHEMKAARVAHYFDEAERLCSYIYYKCWKDTYVASDNVRHSEDSYPVHPHWKLIFKQPCVIPADFFHAFYKMN